MPANDQPLPSYPDRLAARKLKHAAGVAPRVSRLQGGQAVGQGLARPQGVQGAGKKARPQGRMQA